MKVLLLSLFGLFSPALGATAYKGTWVGNGGIVVSCPTQISSEDSPPQYHLLDLIELVPDQVVPQFPKGSLLEKVDALIDRIEPFIPHRAVFYRYLAKNFLQQFKPYWEAPDTNNVGSPEVPEHCALVQVFTQFGYMSPPEMVYLVAEHLWNDLDLNTQAALMLHEILYYEASVMGFGRDAARIRKYVRAIVGNRFEGMTASQFHDYMLSIDLAIEAWKDPNTGKTWQLISPSTNAYYVGKTCEYLDLGTGASRAEFQEAKDRLSRSAVAKRLGLDTARILFWAKSNPDDVKYPFLDDFALFDGEGRMFSLDGINFPWTTNGYLQTSLCVSESNES